MAKARRTVKFNLALKVRVMEHLHWDLLLALVQPLQLGVRNCDILLDVFAWQHDLCVAARTVHAIERPVRNCRRQAADHEHEQVRLEPAVLDNGRECFDDIRYDDERGDKVVVVEGTIALSKTDERRVLDRWEGGRPHGGGRHGGDALAQCCDAPRKIRRWTLGLFG